MNESQQQLIDFLSNQALENSNFESEGLENAENVIKAAYGMQAARNFRKQVAEKRIGKPFIGQSKGSIDRNSKLSFTVVAERLTANITKSLPAMIFGVNDRLSAFQNVMQLPSGVVLDKMVYGADSAISAAGKLQLHFKEGLNIDIIEITCQNNPYPVLLESTKTDLLLMNGVRLSISNTTLVSQFDEQIQIVKNAIAGNTKRDNLTPVSYKNPEQFQSGIVDVPEMISIDKETSLQFNIIPTAGFKVSMNFYAGKIQKWNAGEMV